MTTGFLSLGSVADLWDAQWSGFAYPERRHVLALLSDGSAAGGFAILQGSGQGFREASLGFTASSVSDRDTIAGYAAESTVVTFTDQGGLLSQVAVLDYRASWLTEDLWSITCRLVEVG